MARIPSTSGGQPGDYHHDSPDGEHPSARAAIRHRLFDGEILDGIYRGAPPGVRLLGLTNRRLIMIETITQPHQLAVTSTPLSRVSSVGLVVEDEGSIEEATKLVIKILAAIYEVDLREPSEALEVHDLLIWRIINH